MSEVDTGPDTADFEAALEDVRDQLDAIFDRLVSLEVSVLALEDREVPEPAPKVPAAPEPKTEPKRISRNPWRR